MKPAMKAAAFAERDVYLANWSEAEIHEVNSIPLVIQFKVMACDTQIAVG